MPRPHLKISVPKPCAESWAAMKPETNGRFCDSCATTVIDFSQFSDKELLEYFANRSGKMCGRFSNSQLNRNIFNLEPRQSFFTRLVAAAALFLGISSQLQAQNIYTHPVPSSYNGTEEKPANQKTVTKTPEKVSGDSLVISGSVIDAETKEPLPFGIVIIEGTKLNATTDINGYYRIAISDSIKANEFVVSFRYVGYLHSQLVVKREELLVGKNIGIEATMIDRSMLQSTIGVIVYKPKPWQFRYLARTLWWKTKNFFGKSDSTSSEE
jgi:hypothetical protein